MIPVALTLIVLALLVYGLQRNHARHAHLYTRLPWGMDNEDLDAARFRADLRAARDRQQWPSAEQLAQYDRTRRATDHQVVARSDRHRTPHTAA